MQIKSISIRNFRGIRFAELKNLGNMVVIAGTNGSGKSTIFDAIRLLKSVYGSVTNNEPDAWFGEFQLPIDNTPDAFSPLFNDPKKPLEISATFTIDPNERRFLKAKGEQLIRGIVAKDVTGDGGAWRARYRSAFSRDVRQVQPAIDRHVRRYLSQLNRELSHRSFVASFKIQPNGVPEVRNSPTLETIFSVSEPAHLGGMRYHSAQRNYAREPLQNLSINVVAQANDTTSYLYGNSQYTNIKQEMASAYVKELVARAAGQKSDGPSSLTETLSELFNRFFPNKQFLGPKPNLDGNVYFPVKTGSNSEHDLNDLSSGEKEILYGYLRMRNSSPRYSVVLIDEPELHLNPVLIGGLPDFYNKHLGIGLKNQLWLVTHSDHLLRESLGRRGYSIFHLIPQHSSREGANQAVQLKIDEKARDALYELVGDWAAYRPGAKLVIFEGGGNIDTDIRIVSQLFPKDRDAMNFVSAGGRDQGRAAHEVVEKVDRASDIARKVFSICDRDSSIGADVDGVKRFAWDRYHIENYLLDAKRISAVMRKTTGTAMPLAKVASELKLAAKAEMGSLIHHQMLSYVRSAFGHILDLSVSPKLQAIAPAMSSKALQIDVKLKRLLQEKLSERSMASHEESLRQAFDDDLRTGRWVVTFKGRDILKRFADKNCRQVPYQVFVNLIVDEMAQNGDQPEGMASVMEKIRNTR